MGLTFVVLMSFQVKLIDFSPGEKYLVTYSNQETRDPDGKNVSIHAVPINYCIIDILCCHIVVL